jgi:hypothetical protein
MYFIRVSTATMDDDDEDLPLGLPSPKPKAPDGVSAFSLGQAPRSAADMDEEQNAAIASEDLTVVLQFSDKEVEVPVSVAAFAVLRETPSSPCTLIPPLPRVAAIYTNR